MTGDKEAKKLRKAKANGVRLAITIIEKAGGYHMPENMAKLRELADEIELGGDHA